MVLVAAAAVGGTLAAVSGGSGSPRPGATSTSTTSPPDPADVAAARACQAWNDYLSAGLAGSISPAVGQRLLAAAEALLPANGAQPAGKPLPKWAALGGYLLSAAQDVVNKNTQALSTDGAAVAAQCRTIPPAAAAAGGFTGAAGSQSSP